MINSLPMTIQPDMHRGEYMDRKRTLPKRVVKAALSLASLGPGDYVYVVKVTNDGSLTFQQASLTIPLDK
jgi:hypothetical protein